ncbi:MAG: hypothetical protein H7829_01575 [Magnetococcus sp. THC-1_WYH]
MSKCLGKNQLLKEKRGLGDCPQGFDFDFGFDFGFDFDFGFAFDFAFPRAPSPEAFFPCLFFLKGKMRRRAPWFAFFRGFCERRQTHCTVEGARTWHYA